MTIDYKLCQSGDAGYDKTVLLTLSGLAIFLVASIFYLPLEKTLYFYSDDAYYYFKVASNIIAGYGPSFDGYNLSNGFHPLWMLLLLPVYFLTGNNTELSLQIIFAFQVVLVVFAYWFCWMYVSRVLSNFYGVMSLVVLAVFASPILIAFNGLESALLLFWLFVILITDYKYQLFNKATTSNVVLGGALFGLLFMTRLDTAYIILVFALLKLTVKPGTGGFFTNLYVTLKQYYPAIVIFLLISAPYFIWNYTTFGHFTPISGQIKSSFPYPHFNFNLHAGALPYTLIFLLANIWILAEFLFFRSSTNTFLKRHSVFVKIYWLGSVIHFIWSSLFMQWAGPFFNGTSQLISLCWYFFVCI